MRTQGTYVHPDSGTEVHYQYQPAKDDRSHLVVVFSGYKQRLHSVDFGGGPSRTLKADVLWIYDNFDGQPGYYFWGMGMKDLSAPVHACIQSFKAKLSLRQRDITLFGLSKGAGAALLFAFKFDYLNVVASAPRVRIGQSMLESRPKLLSHIAGEQDHHETASDLDATMETLASADTNKQKNIYAFTSPSDSKYGRDSVLFSRILAPYENAHIIVSHSALVTEHLHVSQYNVPTFTALLSLFSEGLTPRLDGDIFTDHEFTASGGDLSRSKAVGNLSRDHESLVRRPPRNPHDTLIARVRSVTLSEKGALLPQGHCYVSGLPRDAKGLGSASLVFSPLTSKEKPISCLLEEKRNKAISAQEFDSTYVDYSFADFHGGKHGINLRGLAKGTYQVGLSYTQDARDYSLASFPVPNHSASHVFSNGDKVTTSSRDGDWRITALDGRGRDLHDSFFQLDQCEARGQKLFVQGFFVPRGFDVAAAEDIKYYLHVAPVARDSDSPAKVYPLAHGKQHKASTLSGEPWRDQSRAYFTTRRNQGLVLGGLSEGTYDARVVAHVGGDIRGVDLGCQLKIRANKVITLRKAK